MASLSLLFTILVARALTVKMLRFV